MFDMTLLNMNNFFGDPRNTRQSQMLVVIVPKQQTTAVGTIMC